MRARVSGRVAIWTIALLTAVSIIVLAAVMSHDDAGDAAVNARPPMPAPTSEDATTRPTRQTLPPPDEQPDAKGDVALPETSDPDEFAAGVAELVFGMSYRSHRPEDYRSVLLDAVDSEISTEDAEQIQAVISARVPDEVMWQRMADAEQVNTYEVETVWQPAAANDPRAAEWPAGVEARNVSGTQALTYRDENGNTRTDTRPMTITVFGMCGPVRENCTLIGIPASVVS